MSDYIPAHNWYIHSHSTYKERTAHRIAYKPRNEDGEPESTRLGPGARMNVTLFFRLALISGTEAERAEASGVHKAKAE